MDLIDSWIEWYVLYARLKGGRSIIGAGNDIWIGERERITHGIWFRSCNVANIIMGGVIISPFYIRRGDRKFLTVITKIKRKFLSKWKHLISRASDVNL